MQGWEAASKINTQHSAASDRTFVAHNEDSIL